MTNFNYGNGLKIGAWVSPPPKGDNSKKFTTKKYYQAARNCGLNFLHTCYENENLDLNLQALTLAENAGLKLILNDTDFLSVSNNAFLTQKIMQYKKFKSFLGINMADEPGIDKFEAIKKCVDDFGNLLNEDQFFYTNLMPMYASSAQLYSGWFSASNQQENSYEKYFQQYAQYIKIPVFSYDFYPFRGDKGQIDQDYFVQLNLASQLAKNINAQLWNFVQVTSWQKDVIRNMTYSEIAWQVFMSVACGVKGLQYFTFWTPVNRGGENFLPAMMDCNGNKTERYYFVKHINKRLESANVLAQCDFLGVVNKTQLNVPCQMLTSENSPSLKGVNVCGENYLLGCFKNTKSYFYYLVNASLFEAKYFCVKTPKQSIKIVLQAGEGTLICGGNVND